MLLFPLKFLLRSPTWGMTRIRETWLRGSEGLQTIIRPEISKQAPLQASELVREARC